MWKQVDSEKDKNAYLELASLLLAGVGGMLMGEKEVLKSTTTVAMLPPLMRIISKGF